MDENATTDARNGEVVGGEKHCYICWEAANENDKGELHRDCGCRGDNGHCHLPCLITAKKASSNALEPLTRSWLKCNQCQALYADPTKRELTRAMNGGHSLAKRVLSDRTESRLRKAARFVTFYAREVGFWALFDAYYTAFTLLFLAGWAAYIWTAASALQYFTEKLTGEPDYLEQLNQRLTFAITPWIQRIWEESVVFDDFKKELENYQSEIARAALDEELITVGQYIEVDPAVKRVMDDTRENNYWWCCL